MISSSLGYTGNFVSLLPGMTDIEFFGGNGELWTNLTYSSTNVESGSKSTSFYSTSGIDFVTTQGMVWGVLMQIDMSDEEGGTQMTPTGQSFSSAVESFGWLTGPYIVYDNGNYSISGRAALGASTADISPFGSAQSSDEYDTSRLLLSAGITSRGWSSSVGSWSYSPSLGYTYYSESIDDYTINLGNLNPIEVDGIDYELNRLEFDHSFSRTFRYDRNSTMTPSFGVSGIYDTSSTSDTTLTTDDIKARLDAGLVYGNVSGMNWNASVYYEGVGSDNNT